MVESPPANPATRRLTELEREIERAAQALMEADENSFASNLAIARDLWRTHRALVEAKDMPDSLRRAFIRNKGYEPGQRCDHDQEVLDKERHLNECRKWAQSYILAHWGVVAGQRQLILPDFWYEPTGTQMRESGFSEVARPEPTLSRGFCVGKELPTEQALWARERQFSRTSPSGTRYECSGGVATIIHHCRRARAHAAAHSQIQMPGDQKSPAS